MGCFQAFFEALFIGAVLWGMFLLHPALPVIFLLALVVAKVL